MSCWIHAVSDWSTVTKAEYASIVKIKTMQDPVDEEDDWDLAEQVQETINNLEESSKVQDMAPADSQTSTRLGRRGSAGESWKNAVLAEHASLLLLTSCTIFDSRTPLDAGTGPSFLSFNCSRMLHSQATHPRRVS